jgi:hypothetical protein
MGVEPAKPRHEKIVEHEPAAHPLVGGIFQHPSINIAMAVVLRRRAILRDFSANGTTTA